jgi:hypothetical protein
VFLQSCSAGDALQQNFIQPMAGPHIRAISYEQTVQMLQCVLMMQAVWTLEIITSMV